MKKIKGKLAKLKKEISDLYSQYKYYKVKSEWHRMMLRLEIQKEVLEELIDQ